MLTSVLLSLAWALSAPDPAPSAALPEELSALNQLWGDEEKLIEGVRQFDVVQQGLASWDRDLAKEHSIAGDKALAQEKLDQAKHRLDLIRIAYEEVLKRYPENARARVFMGELYYDQYGDLDRGVSLWKEALKIDPKQHEAMNDLAIHYSHEGDAAKSCEYFDSAIKLDPKNADYLFNVTQIYLIHWPQVQKHYGWTAEQVYRKAMDFSRQAAELRPDDYPLLVDYAVNFFRGEQMKLPVKWKEAAVAWQKARAHVRSKAELFYTWLNEGRVWLRAREQAKSTACLEEALKLFPDSNAAKTLMQEAKSGREPRSETTP